MRKVLLCLVLCYLMLCGCSEDSGKTADTTTPVLTIENVAEVVQTFNYTAKKLDIPDVAEDVTETTGIRSTGWGKYMNVSSDGKVCEIIQVRVGGEKVPAVAVYDPEIDDYEIVYLCIKSPESLEWEINTTLKSILKFGTTVSGGYWILDGDYKTKKEIVGINKDEQNTKIDSILMLDYFDLDKQIKHMQQRGVLLTNAYIEGVSYQEILEYTKKGAEVKTIIDSTYRLSLYDSSGHFQKSVMLGTIIPDMNKNSVSDIQFILAENGDMYLYHRGTIYALSADGSQKYTIIIPEEWYVTVRSDGVVGYGYSGLPKLTLDTNGNPAFASFTNAPTRNAKSKPTLFKIDDETQSLINENNLTAPTAYEIFTGPLFSMYYKNNDGFDALSNDGKEVQLFEWSDVGLTRSDQMEFFIFSPDKMYAAVLNKATREWEIYLITNESADDGREVIRIAYDADGSGVKSSDLAAYIREYNATNDDYRIEFVEYTTDKVGRTANEKLISDLLTGEAPDMILFGSSITPEKFVRQGLLIDMYSLMGGDFKKSDFLPCVRTPFENNNGELPYLVTDYIIETMIGKSSNFNGKKSWTFDEMLKMNASLGKDQTLMSLTMRDGDSVPLTLLETLLPNMLGKFIDYEKETCNFGEDFKKLLEFCKTAKVAALNGYISPSYYHEDEVLLNTSSYAVQTFLANHHVNFAGDYTYIGYPEANGSVVKARTTFGITKRSDVAEGAWEFIELYLDEQTEKWEDAVSRTSFDYVSALTFPATYDAFDAMIENLSQYTHFFNFGMVEGDGKLLEQGKYSMTSMITPAADDTAAQAILNKHKLDYALNYTISDDDIDALYALVEGITTAYMSDPAAMNIILEDANDYFIGRKSLDEVVKLIKNRMGILVSE